MSVSRFRPIIINNGQEHQDNLTSIVLPELIGANGTNIREGLNTSRALRSVPPKQQKQKPASVVKSQPLDEGESSRAAQFQNITENHNSTPTANNEIIYRFYVPDDIGDATARIIFDQVCDDCPAVGFHVRANGYPLGGTDQSHGHGTIIRPNQTAEITIPFGVQPNAWHYALLTFSNGADESEMGTDTNHSLSYALQIDYITEEPASLLQKQKSVMNTTNSSTPNPWEPTKFRQMNFYSLLRQTYREFFMFDYDLRPDVNGTVPETLNLTAQTHSGFSFDLGEVSDIGGTLTFALSMKEAHRASLRMSLPTQSPDLGGILAERLIGDPKEEVVPAVTTSSNQSMQIVVCMQLGEPGKPEYPDKCRYGQRLKQASIVVNHTESMGLVHVPFPESGRW